MTNEDTGTELAEFTQGTSRDQAIARAIALLNDGLIEPHEYAALTGEDPEGIPALLASPQLVAAVQRVILQLRGTGALARLEALKHAQEAVKIAADIMRDSDMHPSNRLNAATYVAKVAGTERPTEETRRPPQNVRITINGNRLLLEGDGLGDTHHGEKNS